MEKFKTKTPREDIKLEMDSDADVFMKNIEFATKEVIVAIDHANECIKRGGLTDLNNYDRVILGNFIGSADSEEVELQHVKSETYKVSSIYSTSRTTIDLKKTQNMLDESTLIGKFLSVSGGYSSPVVCSIGGYQILPEKTAITNLIHMAVADYVIERKVEKDLATYNLTTNEERTDKVLKIINDEKERVTRSVKCKQVELFLKKRIDVETLCELVLDTCSM